MSFNLPNPYLVGMLLVVSTHEGPQLVFQCPAVLGDGRNFESDDETDSYVADSESDNESLIDEAIFDARSTRFYESHGDLFKYLETKERHKLTRTDSNRLSGLLGSPKLGVQRPAESKKSTFGFEPDVLAEMLCPPRDMCNQRFDLQIDDLVFLGLPIHNRPDGSWRASLRSVEASESGIKLFHLVFVMNPPTVECNYRIDEMFHYVVSRLLLVLRYEQAKRGYIDQEIVLINKLREAWHTGSIPLGSGLNPNQGIDSLFTTISRNSETLIPGSGTTGATSGSGSGSFGSPGLTSEQLSDLNAHLIQHSSLCRLISDCFESISHLEIANLLINRKPRSFQIPLKTEFHLLPAPTVPYLPGSQLSSMVHFLGDTALVNVGLTKRYETFSPNINQEDDGLDSDVADHLIHFALLLLDDVDQIVKDLRTEPNLTLGHFISLIQPTELLLKLHTRLNKRLLMDQIKLFAFHLVYWRRARVVPPLLVRAVYIVLPMAPVTIKLDEDQIAFQSRFPTLPSLSYFLKMLLLLLQLLKKPRQFLNIIRLRDHREIYLEALAWLVQTGYVTQLHTFLWLKILKRVKLLVEADMESEGERKKSRASIDRNSKAKDVVDNTTKRVDNSSKITDNTTKERPSLSAGSNQVGSPSSSFQSQYENGFGNGRRGPKIEIEEIPDTIIVDPDRATLLERRWINKVVEECKLSPHLTAVFYKILKYFNGRTLFEILLVEGVVVRTDLRKLLAAMEEYVESVRHW